LFAAVQFQVCIQNRYKLNKKMRKLTAATADDLVESPETKTLKAQAKVGAACTPMPGFLKFSKNSISIGH
jgi:hypothetical protein